ncbi:unnamed protein product [Discula destructiva]
MARISWLDALAATLIGATWLSTVCADVARTYPMSVLDWEVESQMQLSITSEGQTIPMTYAVIPLTADLGLNESQTSRGKIILDGRLTLADASTYASISGSDVIPYLCCDDALNSYISANEILNDLMSNDPQPQAILLYSQQGQCCGLSGQNLNFQRLLTMPDNSTASELANFTASAANTARATISGNMTDMPQQQDSPQTGNNSAVAMSILYSITGLITLLFLVIIATGAIRAHRYPERYGPRSGLGGRSRQSRAKGLARAVLETLPIVKFGDTQAVKPDPNVELEINSNEPPIATGARGDTPQTSSDPHLSTIPESPADPTSNVEAVGALRTSSDISTHSTRVGINGVNNANPVLVNDEGLGCSICTEDFTVGEDVRVLPCSHKFHPACVDPWLVNVSGTCPLCRLDLRPEHEDIAPRDEEHLDAPPLGAESNEAGESSSSSRRRSRFFDLARLRHASVEERLEALRRIRTEQRAGLSASFEEETQGRLKLSDRLRDRFHIRTRTAQRTAEQTRISSTTPVSPSHSLPS